MRCLSIQQPWAQYIAAGIKDVENRPWGLKTFPQRVLIHTGKKKQFETYDKLPILYSLIVDNAERMGIVPEFDDLPTGCIIGVVDIVGCTVNDANSSLWAGKSDDPNSPVYNLHLANARLFKEPILGVKGKQGIFEYSEIDEENMPETVDIPSICREGKELFIPMTAEEIEDFAEMDDEGLTYGHHLLNDNLHLFGEFVDDEIRPFATDYITFFHGELSVRVKVIDSEIYFIQDDDGEIVRYFDPAGNELMWVKVLYTVVPEKSRKRRRSPKSATMTMANALEKMTPTCRNIIDAISSAGYSYEFQREPDGEVDVIYAVVEDTPGERYEIMFEVLNEAKVLALTVSSDHHVAKRSVKKTIELVNQINLTAMPAMLFVDPETGMIGSRFSSIFLDGPLTADEAMSMISDAIFGIKGRLPQLLG